MAISGDGSHVLIGVPTWVETNIPNGYVELYTYEATDWVRLDSIAGTTSEDLFGTALAINTDGTKFFVGAPSDDDRGIDAGQVQTFKLYVPDLTNPAVTLSTEGLSYTNVNPFNITITFDEELSGLTPDKITVSNGSAINLSTTDSIGCTADITPESDGNVTIDIAESAVVGLS